VPAEVPRPPGARSGRPAPWSHLPEDGRRHITLAEIRRALAARGQPAGRPGEGAPRDVTPPELPPEGDARPAGVLCLLFEVDAETNVILTTRSAHLRSHGGEVSFPGGRLRPGELPLHAALREANEEIGLDSSGVEVIGELSPLSTRRSPALVQCFVGTFAGPGPGGRALSADVSEVDRIFWVPLARLAADGVFHEEFWPAPDATGGPEKPATYLPVPFFDLEDGVVWGATGRLLTELVDLVLSLRTTGGSPEGTLVK
jgi:8-oxo-dGTP pyrophosphatase MutT (NUDIX family)